MNNLEQNTDNYKIVTIESNKFDLIHPDIDYKICSESIKSKGVNNEVSGIISPTIN